MKIVGITRIRNEEKIIMNTLNHISNFVDEIYIYMMIVQLIIQLNCVKHTTKLKKY